jgi:hypothetical protein
MGMKKDSKAEIARDKRMGIAQRKNEAMEKKGKKK